MLISSERVVYIADNADQVVLSKIKKSRVSEWIRNMSEYIPFFCGVRHTHGSRYYISLTSARNRLGHGQSQSEIEMRFACWR